MRQELFLGWSIPFAMLFAFYSCSHEMDSNLESAVEEAVDLRLDQDSALTRSDLWEEEEESALEWAEDREGKCPYSPCGLCEFKFVPDLDSDTEDGYSYYADFCWNAGFIEESTGQDVSDQYFLQIQWSYTGYMNEWAYINMRGSKYGLVKILGDGALEKIPAYAFPYSTTRRYIYMRMRTIHESFIGATPVPEVETQYKYDRSLFSMWSYPEVIGDPYCNYWGYNRPQPSVDDIINGEVAVDDSSFIVRVYLPMNTDKYSYSCIMYNHNSGYEQSLGGTTNSNNEGMAIGTNIGKSGGQIEVIAKRTNKLTGDVTYETSYRDYSAGDKNVDIYISEYAFGYE